MISVRSLILILLIACAVSVAQSAPAPNSERTRKGKRDLLVALQQENGLHKVAKENGGVFKLVTPFRPYVQPNTLNDVFLDTALIVRATVLKNACRLNPHGNTIRTDYDVSVNSVLYGKLEKREITVSLPGGMFRFEDGTVAEHSVPEYRRMENGSTMFLFLRRDQEGRFAPATGPGSLFEIVGGKVFPYAPRGSSLTPTYHAMDETAFIAEIIALPQSHPAKMRKENSK